MVHTVKVVSKKRLSDGQIAVCLRCCDDESTDSWSTLGITGQTVPADIAAWVQDRKADIKALHQAHLDADAALDTLIG
jgi:hypothetical protein